MHSWIDIFFSFITLTILEIVLGIDNIVFIAIITQNLPPEQQKRARKWGLSMAWITRLLLLAGAVAISNLTTPLFSIGQYAISSKDLFFILGGLFLLFKATQEIHLEIEAPEKKNILALKSHHFWVLVMQIAVLDIVFSLDSVLTAIGLTNYYWLMALSITIAIIVMLFASESLTKFIERYPTIKMLALSFLMLIGIFLIADGLSFHIPRGYLYFGIGFSLFIEFLNNLRRTKRGD